MARRNVVHKHQHQRNDARAAQCAGFQGAGAVRAAVQHKADERDHQHHEKDHTAAADVGFFHERTRDIRSGCHQLFGGMLELIDDGLADLAVGQQLQPSEIHAAAAEIGCGQLGH